ncbi:MAG: hypothetical protein KC502_01180 [Myxococcales bacterium]|nr:hypothetical protein [Myxococcales bacterium]
MPALNLVRRALAVLLCTLALGASPAAASPNFQLPGGLSQSDRVPLGSVQPNGAAQFHGVRLPESVATGGSWQLELWFSADKPLPKGTWIFVHVESATSTCRVVQDAPAPAAKDGLIHHTLTLQMPKSDACKPQRMEVRVGLYNRGTGKRLAVKQQPDDRIHGGYFHIADGGATDLRTLSPSQMSRQRFISAAHPWRWWGLGLLLALVLLAVVRRKLLPAGGASDGPDGDETADQEASDTKRGIVHYLLAVVTAVTSVVSILMAIDFVKDDAYISFRYAHNVVRGEGLVFNAHDKLEGITNFLWTVVLVPFEALGLDLFQVTEVLGSLLILGLLAAMVRLSEVFIGRQRSGSAYWAALIIASSSSVGLWTTSGMEQPLAMILPYAGALWLWRSWRKPHEPAAARDALIAGILVGLGCMTRPDIHLIGVLLAVPLIIRALKTRQLDPVLVRFAMGGLLVTVPGHLWRYLYYGALMPNTYYVKTGGGVMVWLKGAEALWEMWAFNGIGVLAILSPLAFIHRKFTAEKLVLAFIAAGNMAYIIKVGRDEMHWHRLYLPALPFLATLAALGLHGGASVIGRLLRPLGPRVQRALPAAIGWALVLLMVAMSLRFTYREMNGFNGRGDLSGNYHPDMGKFVTRHARPGALVAFQDMGSTPYHAPDLDFFDFIGLTDRVIARTRHRYGLHAFLETAAQRNQGAYDSEMRDYFYKQRPEWVILTSYIHGSARMNQLANTFAKAPVPESLGWSVGGNRYQLGVYRQKFKDTYAHVRTWPRSRGYYLSLFYRKDLWDKTPGEVVLDKLPAQISGAKAQFERGVKLLGSDLPAEVTEKYGVYLTLWLEVTEALEKDWWVFVHIEGAGGRHPADHVPGDFMWPADRWQKGQIIEDRTLVQLPPTLRPGTYDVWIGLYRRSNGERLKVTQGAHDGQHRIKVGQLQINAQRPFIDHLIRPTQLSIDRKYPERIISHGRKPTDYAERATLPAHSKPVPVEGK